jgi:UDP-glucose 4-epimerase
MVKKRHFNILVTGGSGFLGSHVSDALSEEGHMVSVLDIRKSSFLRSDQKMIIADIMDQDAINKALHNIDIVFHFAALADIDLAYDKPLSTMTINVLGTTHILEAARLNKVKKVVFGSTVYVNSRTGSFYRVSKHACELLIEEYQQHFGLDYSILRFGTLYGTRSDNSNSVYSLLNEALTSGGIKFFGSGNEVREFIHVSDAARICVELLNEKYNGETLILTGHHRYRLFELIDMINEILGNKIKISYESSESKSHYIQTPYSYIPRVGKKIITNTYCDLGQSLVEILDEIETNNEKECILI